MSDTTEVLLMWTAVSVYAVATVLFIVGFMFGKERLTALALAATAIGIVPHALAVVGRWVRLGHGPYLGFYEVISSFALLGSVVFLLLALRVRGLRVAGTALMPIAFLALGGAMLAPRGGLDVTPALASYWLGIHVAFAKLTYGSLITGFGLAIMFLLRAKRPDHRLLSRLPDDATLDDLVFKFVAAGFMFLGIMIAAGAVWANEAWGRYWGWDPIETWSLISWLGYAAVLHARLTLGWKGPRFMWAAIAALPVVLFALVGVAVVYNSIHGAYLTGP
ncbi:MAG: cytochrome c biogenesis protein CcsA [Coriobacteriia bacterium]